MASYNEIREGMASGIVTDPVSPAYIPASVALLNQQALVAYEAQWHIRFRNWLAITLHSAANRIAVSYWAKWYD